jgi:uncharacterized protein (DUF1501 family)
MDDFRSPFTSVAPAGSWSRRRFLSSACAAVGMTSLASTAFDLRRIAAAAVTPGYQALVCVFLYGGNDCNNTLVPASGPDYNAYAAARGGLALPQASLRPISPLSGADGRPWALHPSLINLQTLFTQERLAIIANVGPLVAPLTKAQYEAGTSDVPPQLFSHSDQTLHWQTSLPDQPARTGWGGRVADLVHSLNTNPRVSMSMSLADNNTFQIGNAITQYQVSSDGSIGLGGYYAGNDWNHPPSVALRSMLGQSYGNLAARGYRDVFQRALDQDALLATALAAAPTLTTVFPDTDLARQLSMVARLISVSQELGLSRQVFFCAAGGYDTHGGQVGAQAEVGAHSDLLSELDGALGAFFSATVELNVVQQVTTFTASDFGRTYLSNGDGSDHGWGAHHFVLGGSVIGRRIYGTPPVLAVDGPDDSGEGRWIPSLSVDEYSATLARWFGVSSSNMSLVLPNIGRFGTADLGFMS